MSAPVCTCAQAALIRFLISVVSCCRNVIIWPKYFVLSPLVRISILMSSTCISFFVSELRQLWLLRIFVFSGWILRPSSFLEVAQHFLKQFFRGCEQKHVVGKPQVREAVVVVVAQVDSHSFFSFASAG